jgi:hypothetical protein
MTIRLNRSRRIAAACVTLTLAAVMASVTSASAPLGIYGIVESVVFEPDDRAPERVQVWGAFAYVHMKNVVSGAEGRPSPRLSAAQRGYLYFTLPADGESVDTVRHEWADLEAVAGTGQAVGFGTWGHTGRFDALRPDGRPNVQATILERVPSGGTTTDLRVRPASETPTNPSAYQTNAGIVKLTAGGSHAAIVKQLEDALEK